jgi:hypothetical protein
VAIIRKQRRFGKLSVSGAGAGTKLPISTNYAPIWILSPQLNFIIGTATSVYVAGTDVYDPDGNALTITYVGSALPTGVTFVQGAIGTARYVYNGAGSVTSFANAQLRATDNGVPILSSDSSVHTITISSSLAWTGTPAPFFEDDRPGQTYSLSSFLTGSGAGSAVITVVNGTLPIGCAISGQLITYNGTNTRTSSSVTLRATISGQTADLAMTVRIGGWNLANLLIPRGGSIALTDYYDEAPGEMPVFGTATQAISDSLSAQGMTVSNGILTHDNRPNETTVVSGVRFTSDAVASGELILDRIISPKINNAPIIFGKHWSWVRRSVDGKYYTCSGDGGLADGGPSGSGNARWIRLDPATGVADYYYPRRGTAGQLFPHRPDSYDFYYRPSLDSFTGLPGYLTAEAPVGETGIPFGGGSPTANGLNVRCNWSPGAAGWTYSLTNWAISTGSTERNCTKNYDPVSDKVYLISGVSNGFHTWDLANDTTAVQAPILTGQYTLGCDFSAKQDQVYIPDTDEVVAYTLANNSYNQFLTQNLSLVAMKCSGPNKGLTRRLWTWDRPPYESLAGGQAGQNPMVLVPSRRRLYLFLWEYLDAPIYYNTGTFRYPFDAAHTGGIVKIQFDNTYSTVTNWSVAKYPTELASVIKPWIESETGKTYLNDIAAKIAVYDPARDEILLHFFGDTTSICFLRFAA